MALRLGGYVIYGELRNKRGYSTYGAIALRGEQDGDERIVHLQLTGDCAPDLKDKFIRFMPRDEEEAQIFPGDQYDGLQDRQIGPTGLITAKGWVRAIPCAVEEFYHRAKLGEPPPTEWKRRLYLEWYSQNGRVVVEMVDPIIEECVREGKGVEDEGEWIPLPHPTPHPDLAAKSAPDPYVTSQDGETDDEQGNDEPFLWDDEDCEFGEPIPPSLQASFDRESDAIDLAIRAGEDNPDDEAAIREMELMDYCIEHSDGEPLSRFGLHIDQLPNPDDLDDASLEGELKALLARLAHLNVALDVCEHFTPRDCYRLLVDTLLAETNVHKELVGTGWVQHMSTYEYCPQCEAEYDADLDDESGDESEGDETLPF